MYKINLGPISEGTLKTDDLLTAFAWELQRYVDHKDEVLMSDELGQCQELQKAQQLIDTARMYATLIDLDHLNEDGLEAAAEVVNELTDKLTEIAPAYVWFGASEGDGASFGFWPCLDQLNDDVTSGEVLKVDDLSQVPEGYAGTVMQVSDHGNIELYEAKAWSSDRFTSLWSCV